MSRALPRLSLPLVSLVSLLSLLSLASCNSCDDERGLRKDPSVSVVGEGGDARPGGRPWLEYVPAGEGDVQSLVKTELGRARNDGVRLLVYVGAAWCEPCQRFHEAAASGVLDKRLPRIRFFEFDLDRDGERLAVAGYTSQYIPMFAIPGEDGRSAGKYIEGSMKGVDAAEEITPRLLRLLAP